MNEVKDFAQLGVDEPLCEALAKQDITKPTAIQCEILPKALEGQSILGEAPTGTGKTLAYLLPTLMQLDAEAREVQAVILAPTYELAMQITNTARDLSQQAELGIRVQGLIGGANIARQIDKLKEKPQLIIGSAGRLLELARRKKLQLNKVKVLVLDEFDRMLDDQNLQNTADVVRLMPPREEMQILLFSATTSRKALERASFLGNSEHIVVEDTAVKSGLRDDYYRITPFREKIEVLRKLTRRLNITRGLVFINKRFDVEKTLSHLRYEGLSVESLISAGGKQERQHAVSAFSKGKVRLLLATDVAARGLDIPGIDYVVNLDVPENAQAYLHRAGRTARAGAHGTVITLADIKEAYKLELLEKQLKIALKPLEPGGKALPKGAPQKGRAAGHRAPARGRKQGKAAEGKKSSARKHS
ncbi:MAG: DEAD/DEAH box helicase [Selenomonas sp.]|nr:DEAD/DEAH box helicase [Selenomonas sp.]